MINKYCAFASILPSLYEKRRITGENNSTAKNSMIQPITINAVIRDTPHSFEKVHLPFDLFILGVDFFWLGV